MYYKRLQKANVLLLLLCSNLYHPMEVTTYLKHPEQYAAFRLTRSYGKPLQSNFDCLPTEVIESYIKPFLSQCIAQKFKQKLFQYRKKLDKNDDAPQNISFQKKAFHYHDGKYVLMPDIADYSMCDGKMKSYLGEHFVDNPNKLYLKLLSHISPELDIRLYISLANYKNKNKRSFKLARRTNEGFIVNKILLACDVTSYLFSGNGKWLILSSSDQAGIAFINVYKPAMNILSFNNQIVDVATSHHSSLLGISEPNKVWLLKPNKYTTSLKIDFNIKTIQFSPDNRYLLACGEGELLLCELKDIKTNSFNFRPINFFSALQKTFFSPDNKQIVIAFKDGKLLFWKDFFNRKPINLYNAQWKINDHQDNNDPLIVWSKDTAFLFSLNPRKNTNLMEMTFTIRKAKNGKLITGYSCFPNNFTITGIGLTKHENTIVLINKNNDIAVTNLYDEIGCKCINFITKAAYWYQLCYLEHLIKKIKYISLLEATQSFIKGMMP